MHSLIRHQVARKLNGNETQCSTPHLKARPFRRSSSETEVVIASQKEHEQQEAEARSSPSGAVIYRAVLKEGLEELDHPSPALFWSGLAAGFSMGASLIAEGLLAAHLPPTDWKPLLTKLGYSFGFVIGGVALVAAINHGHVFSGRKS